MSTNTGVAPRRAMTSAVVIKVKVVVKTASPGPTPSAIRGRRRASVPLEQARQYFVPAYAASDSSSSAISLPLTNAVFSKMASSLFCKDGRMSWYCFFRSMKSILFPFLDSVTANARWRLLRDNYGALISGRNCAASDASVRIVSCVFEDPQRHDEEKIFAFCLPFFFIGRKQQAGADVRVHFYSHLGNRNDAEDFHKVLRVEPHGMLRAIVFCGNAFAGLSPDVSVQHDHFDLAFLEKQLYKMSFLVRQD